MKIRMFTIDEERRNRFLWGELPANLRDANPTLWEKITYPSLAF